MQLYPLKFNPIYKDKLWGGQKIKSVLGKDFGNLANCGETWEVSGVNGNISIVSNGELAGKGLQELIKTFQGELVGQRVFEKFGNDFPLLIKFIDANDDLSIQVHPDDQLAKERHNSFGKTEMWYVLQADQGAKLITGFNQEINREKYIEHFENGQLSKILNQEEVSTGDVYFLPAGRVHTIGKGMMIAEIQQTSDITYRIYDFDRVDANGHKRELHVEEALDAIDYEYHDQYKTTYKEAINEKVPLVKCNYFETNKLSLDRELKRNYTDLDSFVILICVAGKGKILTNGIEEYDIQIGESLLVPANMKEITIMPDSNLNLLETYVP